MSRSKNFVAGDDGGDGDHASDLAKIVDAATNPTERS